MQLKNYQKLILIYNIYEMEKLIELLNEYEDLTDAEECEKWYIDEYDRISEWWRRTQWTNTWICSKKFGFIKWLVDNDKIEINKLREESFNIWLSLSSNFRKNKNGGLKHYYECKLLMLLAISDTTIDDLISYLK